MIGLGVRRVVRSIYYYVTVDATLYGLNVFSRKAERFHSQPLAFDPAFNVSLGPVLPLI